MVVGETRHPTPVLATRVAAIVFNPPWSIPTTIATAEILPRLRRDPRYLADHDILVLERLATDPHGLDVRWAEVPATWFPFRLVQRPGPDNPLGGIKLDMPNVFDVYIHATPLAELFAHPRRTLSHGCVRVERARELAARLLADQPGLDPEAIDRALAEHTTSRVPLRRPLPVYSLYWTAFVAEDGALHFREDAYGLDRRFRAALARRVEGRPLPPPGRDRPLGCPDPDPRSEP